MIEQHIKFNAFFDELEKLGFISKVKKNLPLVVSGGLAAYGLGQIGYGLTIKSDPLSIKKEFSKGPKVDTEKALKQFTKEYKKKVKFINIEDPLAAEKIIKEIDLRFAKGLKTGMLKKYLEEYKKMNSPAVFIGKNKYILIGKKQMPYQIFYHELGHIKRIPSKTLSLRRLGAKLPLKSTMLKEEIKAHENVPKKYRDLKTEEEALKSYKKQIAYLKGGASLFTAGVLAL